MVLVMALSGMVTSRQLGHTHCVLVYNSIKIHGCRVCMPFTSRQESCPQFVLFYRIKVAIVQTQRTRE